MELAFALISEELEVLVVPTVELVWSTTAGVVLTDVVSVPTVAVRVVELQALRLSAKPATMSENRTEFFIGGLSCPTTDPSMFDRFANR